MRHPSVAAPCRIPGLEFVSAVVLANSFGHSLGARSRRGGIGLGDDNRARFLDLVGNR